MKYRRLAPHELEPLAEDFAIFLATNSVDKKEWDMIKSYDPIKAAEIIDVFSDMVFEKALKSAKFLERISETEIHCYVFHPSQAHLISARITANSTAGFLANNIASTLTDLIKSESLEIIQGTKKYNKPREEEMFDILQTGAILSKGELYRALVTLL